jgi:hypothetical protein
MKLAQTVCAVVIERVQVGAVPLQLPPHELRVYPVIGAAVKVTGVPDVKVCVQSPGQLMPVPVMVPFVGAVTVRVYVVGSGFVFVLVFDVASDA